MSLEPLLIVDGEVEQPMGFGFNDFAAFPAADQVADVSRFPAKKSGDGVTLEAVLARVRPRPGATYLTLHASRDDFHASIPLAPILAEGVVVYALGGSPLPAEKGGPIRFLIRNP